VTSSLILTDVVGPAVLERLAIVDRPELTPQALKAHQALQCDRRIGFGLLGVPQDVPYTKTDRLAHGDWIDARSKEALAQEVDALVDFPWSLTDHGFEMWGKADAWWPAGVVSEVKSVTDGSFAWATGGYRSSADKAGPNVEHIAQGALGALALEAPTVHVAYFNIGDRGDPLSSAEWLLPMAEPLAHLDADPLTCEKGSPTPLQIAQGEAERQQGVLTLTRGGVLPARFIPGYGFVDHTPPAAGQDGDPKPCTWCPWQPSCAALSAGPIEDFLTRTAES
jgi:hypothetical protein